MKPLFVTGIDTGVGKTIVSAILVEKLQADYWKPIQSGDLSNTDTNTVKSLVSNTKSKYHPEAYRLTQPYSPHKAADIDGIRISTGSIILPQTKNKLIIEGAGGLMVPLNEKDLLIDLIKLIDAEVILVSKNYLGSINHTLLSLEALRSRGIPLRGIIFTGDHDSYSEDLIMKYSGINSFAKIPTLKSLNKRAISKLGDELGSLKL